MKLQKKEHGSATEAVLLDLLLQQKPTLNSKLTNNEPFEKWRLDDLIKTALKLNLLGKATGNLTQIVRQHRNLIHPGRSLREKKFDWPRGGGNYVGDFEASL